MHNKWERPYESRVSENIIVNVIVNGKENIRLQQIDEPGGFQLICIHILFFFFFSLF